MRAEIKTMRKKIIFSLIGILLLVIIAGGFFWWRNQKDVRELNKNLPEGVRVVKNFFGEYRVVNKIDGYEFKLPKEIKSLKEVKYYTEEEKKPVGISIEGIGGEVIGVGYYKLIQPDKSLESWINDWSKEWVSYFQTFNWEIEKKQIGNFEVFKVSEEKHLAGLMSFYFFKKNLRIYQLGVIPEKFIREIILNGKW